MSAESRLSRLRGRMAEDGLDAMLIFNTERCPSKNVAYFSGFRGTHGCLWITRSDALLATDSRYTEQAGEQAPDFRIVRLTGEDRWLENAAGESGARRIGFEDDAVSVALLGSLSKQVEDLAPQAEFVPTGGMADRLRAVKDAHEIELLAKAIAIADEAVETVGAALRPGMTERQVAWDIERAMREFSERTASRSPRSSPPGRTGRKPTTAPPTANWSAETASISTPARSTTATAATSPARLFSAKPAPASARSTMRRWRRRKRRRPEPPPE